MDFSQVKEAVAKRPWLPWVLGGLLIGAFALLSRRSSGSGGAIVAAPVPQAAPSGPRPIVGGSGQGDSLKASLDGLAQQQAAFMTQSLAAQQSQYQQFLTSMQNMWNQQRSSITETYHQTSAALVTQATAPVTTQVSTLERTVSTLADQVAALVVPAKQDPAPTTVALKTWVEGDTYAGYVDRTVSIGNSFEQMIYDAKQQFYAAEDSGDQAALAEARRQATLARQLAATEGVELAAWAR